VEEDNPIMKKFLFGALLAAAAVVSFVPAARAVCPDDPAAAIAATCPCEGQGNGNGNGGWKNHGKYQSCVVRFRNDLRREGCLTADTQRTIARCAARSTCGKEGAVVCCHVTGTGTCTGATATTPGTCSNDATESCMTDADCTTLSVPRIKRHAENCTEPGGYVSGTGSVCAGCAAPVACCLAGGCQILTNAACTAQGGTTTPGAAPVCDPSPCP
jgi:hypothetical protein